MQLCSSLNIILHCSSLGLDWKVLAFLLRNHWAWRLSWGTQIQVFKHYIYFFMVKTDLLNQGSHCGRKIIQMWNMFRQERIYGMGWNWRYPYCRRKWRPIPVFLFGKFHGQKSLAGCSPRGHKESDMILWLNNNNKKLWFYLNIYLSVHLYINMYM